MELKEGNIAYIYYQLEERNGEQEYRYREVTSLCIKNTKNAVEEIEAKIEELASRWYDGGPVPREDGGYYFHGGSLHVSVQSFTCINQEDFSVLSRYL